MAVAVVALVITGVGLTVKVSVLVTVPNALLAESLIVLMPAAVGVPEITPVAELRLKPAGSSVVANGVVAWSAVMV